MYSTASPVPLSDAKSIGIRSFAGAIAFAGLYAILLGWFTFLTIRQATCAYVYLSFFCIIRLTAFVLRAYMATLFEASDNTSVLIAYEVLYSIGFFGLLYSAYILILYRESLSDGHPNENGVNYILRSHRLFRLSLILAMVLGSLGITLGRGGSIEMPLRTASAAIFLVLVVLVFVQALQLLRLENEWPLQGIRGLGSQCGTHIILAICALLLAREAFLAATIYNVARQNEEALWYPLVATTELVSVVLYATPGLVPLRRPFSRATSAAELGLAVLPADPYASSSSLKVDALK